MNQPAKSTPLEVLQKQKVRLQIKSDALTEIVEAHFEYLRQNMAPILGECAQLAIVSKMPAWVQILVKQKNKTGKYSHDLLTRWPLLMDGILDILPLFLKGTKGAAAGLLLKCIKNLLIKK
jgi:hypothetical protein